MRIRIEFRQNDEVACSVEYKSEERPELGNEVMIDFADPDLIFTPGTWDKPPAGTWICDVHNVEQGGDLFLVTYQVEEDPMLLRA